MHPAASSFAPHQMANAMHSLSYLTQIDQILVKQKKEMLEVLTGWESPNRYAVLNNMGQQIFTAREKSGILERQFLGPQRGFEMEICDAGGHEAIHVSRPYKCMFVHQACSCMDWCMDEVTVEAPPGRLAGKVRQLPRKWHAEYQIFDSADMLVLTIVGPHYCKCYCPGEEIPFSVRSADGVHEVGRVSRQWSNLLQEYFTDADNFGITFPVDLAVDVKATVIGACFLIDFMYFESSQ